MVTQSQIAKHIGVDVSTVNKILNRRQGPVFSKETIRKVFKAARQLGFPMDKLKHNHRRLSDRKAVDLPARVDVYRPDGTVLETGDGILQDVSAGGCRLEKVRIPSGVLPIGCIVGISSRVHSSDLRTPRRGHVVRLIYPAQSIGLSIRFLDQSGPHA